MTIAIHIGKPEEAKERENRWAPPPQGSGIYRGTINSAEMKTWDDGKNPPMLALGVKCTKHMESGEDTTGHAEWVAFSIAPDQEATYANRYDIGDQKFRWRNLLSSGFGAGAAIAEQDKKGKTVVTGDYASWKGKEVFFEARVYDRKSEGKTYPTCTIDRYLSAEEVAARLSGDDGQEGKSLEEAAGEPAAGAEIPTQDPDSTPETEAAPAEGSVTV